MIVKVEKLNKSYTIADEKFEILTNLDFSVAESEIVSVEGASGVGKSTLLNILGAMDSFDTGSVNVLGDEIHRMNTSDKEKYRAEKISFIFQHHLLLPDFTALENVMIPLLIGNMPVREADMAAREMLGRVGLKERSPSYPAQLSGGESARVGVARALVARKKLILADEPTGNLDRDNSKKLMNLILDLQKEFNFSMIIVTHDMELAALAHKRNRIVSGKLEPINH